MRRIQNLRGWCLSIISPSHQSWRNARGLWSIATPTLRLLPLPSSLHPSPLPRPFTKSYRLCKGVRCKEVRLPQPNEQGRAGFNYRSQYLIFSSDKECYLSDRLWRPASDFFPPVAKGLFRVSVRRRPPPPPPPAGGWYSSRAGRRPGYLFNPSALPKFLELIRLMGMNDTCLNR